MHSDKWHSVHSAHLPITEDLVHSAEKNPFRSSGCYKAWPDRTLEGFF